MSGSVVDEYEKALTEYNHKLTEEDYKAIEKSSFVIFSVLVVLCLGFCILI